MPVFFVFLANHTDYGHLNIPSYFQYQSEQFLLDSLQKRESQRGAREPAGPILDPNETNKNDGTSHRATTEERLKLYVIYLQLVILSSNLLT